MITLKFLQMGVAGTIQAPADGVFYCVINSARKPFLEAKPIQLNYSGVQLVAHPIKPQIIKSLL